MKFPNKTIFCLGGTLVVSLIAFTVCRRRSYNAVFRDYAMHTTRRVQLEVLEPADKDFYKDQDWLVENLNKEFLLGVLRNRSESDRRKESALNIFLKADRGTEYENVFIASYATFSDNVRETGFGFYFSPLRRMTVSTEVTTLYFAFLKDSPDLDELRSRLFIVSPSSLKKLSGLCEVIQERISQPYSPADLARPGRTRELIWKSCKSIGICKDWPALKEPLG